MVAFPQVPTWLLIVAGSFLVGVSSIFGPILLSILDGKIRAITEEIEKFKGKRKDDAWNRTVRAHQQLSNATILFALSEIGSESERELVLEQAANNATGFLVDSLVIVLEDDPEHSDISRLDREDAQEWLEAAGIKRSFTELQKALSKGDSEAYRDVEKMRVGMIGYAQYEMLQAEEESAKLSARLQRIRWWKATTQYVAASLSLIGITFVLLGNVLSRFEPAPPSF